MINVKNVYKSFGDASELQVLNGVSCHIEKGEQVDARVDATRDKGTLNITSYDKETGDVLPGCTVEVRDEDGNVFKTILGSVSSSSSGIPYNLKEYY